MHCAHLSVPLHSRVVAAHIVPSFQNSFMSQHFSDDSAMFFLRQVKSSSPETILNFVLHFVPSFLLIFLPQFTLPSSCLILGFRHSVEGIVALLGCYASFIGSYRDFVQFIDSIFKCQAVLFDTVR
jgi:hypothetical protein